MPSHAEANFIGQQGFACAAREDSGPRFAALSFQPKVMGVLVALGLVLQAWPVFLGLGVISWWNVLVPGLNPFDLAYNHLLAGREGRSRLGPAPAPRRFAQGMAGTFMLAVAVLLFLHWHVAAYVVQAMLVVALSALLFGRFCLGSYIFHLVRGQAKFANDTLPWRGA
jgi:hypothetical protein